VLGEARHSAESLTTFMALDLHATCGMHAFMTTEVRKLKTLSIILDTCMIDILQQENFKRTMKVSDYFFIKCVH